MTVFEDITQRKMDEAELLDYRQRLEGLVAERTAQLNITNEQLQAEGARRQRLQDELLLRLEWLVTYNLFNKTVTRTADLAQAYQKFTEVIGKLFAAEAVFIAEIDPEQRELVLQACTHREMASQDWVGSVIPLSTDLLSNPCFALGEPDMFNRDQIGQVSDQMNAYMQRSGCQFFMLAPLLIKQRIVGLLGLEYAQGGRQYSDGDTALLVKICADIAQLRENAWYFEQTRELAAAEERNRLARDLHDSVTQVLFAASLVAEVLPQIWRRSPAKGISSLEELRRLTRGALAEMRTMLLELRPSALIKTPLSELLVQLTEAITGRTGLPFQLFIEQVPPLPEDVHINFYRIAQESLNNVVKHASASHVAVNLSANPHPSAADESASVEVTLIVWDDGRGFLPEKKGLHTLGLGIMRERAAAIQANLTVESQPGAETTVTLTWLGHPTKGNDYERD